MKKEMSAKPFVIVASLAVAILCAYSVANDAKTSVPGGMASTNAAVKVDFDFTRMNSTMRMTQTYRLGANPKEFEGKTLRLSGVLLTRIDKKDGKRYFGCLIGEAGGCACCSPGGVLEFEPKSSYKWPTDFPSVNSRITISGLLKMMEVGDEEQSYSIPRLVDADISPSPSP